MVTVGAFALMAGLIWMPSQSAQAASALKKSDFKFTGKYQSGMNAIINSKKAWQYHVVNTINEKSPKKCIRTKRGITLGSTKASVLKKYGKTEPGTFKSSGAVESGGFYDLMKKSMEKNTFKLIDKEKILQYWYYDGKKNTNYTIIFCFDKKNKVNSIIATKGIVEW